MCTTLLFTHSKSFFDENHVAAKRIYAPWVANVTKQMCTFVHTYLECAYMCLHDAHKHQEKRKEKETKVYGVI